MMNDFEQGGLLLLAATARVRDTVILANPLSLGRLIDLNMLTFLTHKAEISVAILQQFEYFGNMILGSRHPFPRVYGFLAKTATFQISDT